MEAIKYKSLSQLAKKTPGHVQTGSTMVRWSYIKRAAAPTVPTDSITPSTTHRKMQGFAVPCIEQHQQSVAVQKEGAKGSKSLGQLINQMIGGSTSTSVCVHGRRKTQCKDCGTRVLGIANTKDRNTNADTVAPGTARTDTERQGLGESAVGALQ
jgi:hypothetical protein